MRSLSPEGRVLLLSAGGPANDAAIRDRIAAGIDWRTLLSLAHREKATSMLLRRLDRCAPHLLPPEIRTDLHRLARVRDFQQAYLADRLREVVGELDDHGVDVLLLKGAALACTVYAGFRYRPMADLDLLVPAGRAADAQRILSAAGWEPAGSTPDDTQYQQHQHLRPLIDAARVGVWVELHTDLLPRTAPFRFSPQLLCRAGSPR